MEHELRKKRYVDPGSHGRPSWYPTPDKDRNLLFYIQRNQNQDAIVYSINRTLDNRVNEDLPMDAYWIRYTNGGQRQELSVVQNKLAYGYFRFQFVSYDKLVFYIRRIDQTEDFEVVFEEDNSFVILNNIYVYALEFGVFPDVQFIELYGSMGHNLLPHYKKINIK